MDQEPKSTLVGRIMAALAEDDRSNALDIQLTVAGGKLFLIGSVSTEELRRAIESVVAEAVHGQLPIVNTITVAEITEAPGAPEPVG
jgi:osmotically-inducible protein OsmY